MFKTWKRIEKRFRKMKAKEEDEKRKKAKKDSADDKGKGHDGDKRKKDDGEDKAKKGDRDKRKRKDDDDIAGEELEEQIRAEADRQRRQERREDQPEDTLEYVQDEDDDDVGEQVDDNDNGGVEEEVDDNDGHGDDDEKREEPKPFNFEEEMGTLCKRLKSSHGHRAEEELRTQRMIRAYHKKKKWLNLRAEKEAEQKQAMAQKFDEDLRLRFQEEAEKQRLKAAQELRKEEERKLEEIVKQLSAEHGVAEEDIRLQMQAVQDIVRAEVEKKVENERREEEKRRREQIAREREEAEEKRRREEIEKMVRQREEEEREQNWAEKEDLGLQALYQREKEIEFQIGLENADAMAWEDELERRFEEEMMMVCEQYELRHERLVEEQAQNRRIKEAEHDRAEVEYETDWMWMAEELAILDNEAKLKWIEDEDKEIEEIGETWDRLGPYTESDGEMVKVLIAEEEKQEELDEPSTPSRGRRKRRRGGRLTLRRRKKVKVESEEQKEERYVQHLGVNHIELSYMCVLSLFANVNKR